MSDKIDLSIIIVNWNSIEFLKVCIDSIEEKIHGLKYEIIIIDNNSRDFDKEILKKEYNKYQLIINDTNLGFAKANNQGLDRAVGRYIVFLNPDTKVVTNAFLSMINFLDNNKDFAVIGCKLLNTDGTNQITSARKFPTLFNQFCYFFLLDKLLPGSRLCKPEDMESRDLETSQEVDVISGACLLVRNEIVKKLHGLDENIFMYSEEVDLCYRIKKLGYKVYYLSKETIYHYVGASTNKKKNKHFVPVRLRNAQYYYFKKHFGNFTAACYRIIIFFGSLLRIYISILGMIFLSPFKKTYFYEFNTTFAKYVGTMLWSVNLINVKKLK